MQIMPMKSVHFRARETNASALPADVAYESRFGKIDVVATAKQQNRYGLLATDQSLEVSHEAAEPETGRNKAIT